MNQMTRFCAKDNRELIEYLKSKGVIKSPTVFETMCLVDRKKYVNNYNPYNNAYIDAPQNIGHGRTISAPHMHGAILENLADKLVNGKNVLNIRCSTGYLSTCMAIMLGPNGSVVHIESIQELYEKIKKNIENDYPDLLLSNRIQLFVENESIGYTANSPYDIICIGAATAEIPQSFIDQLAIDGRLIIPVGSTDGNQKLMQIEKTVDGKIETKSLMTVRYDFLNIYEANIQEKHKTSISRESFLNRHAASSAHKNNYVNNILKNITEERCHQDTQQVECLNYDSKLQYVQYTDLDSILTPILDTKLNMKIDEKLNVKQYQSEQRILQLQKEMKKFEYILKQEIAEQKILLCAIDEEIKSKIEKLNSKVESKVEAVEKDNKIVERKSNKKISKVKGMIEYKINNEVDELSKQLYKLKNKIMLFTQEINILTVSFEEKIAKEKANIYIQLNTTLEEREQKHWDSVKNKIMSFENEIQILNRKLTEKETKLESEKLSIYYNFVFPMIIMFHAAFIFFKKLS